MPESVEVPAPVRATTEPSASHSPISYTPPRHRDRLVRGRTDVGAIPAAHAAVQTAPNAGRTVGAGNDRPASPGVTGRVGARDPGVPPVLPKKGFQVVPVTFQSGAVDGGR